MKASVWGILSVVLIGPVAQVARAGDYCCPPQYTLIWVDKPVVCQRMEWHTRDVPCEGVKQVYREEVRVHLRDVLVPEERTVLQDVVTCVLKPVTQYQDVCRQVMVPVSVCDPCTGCCYTVCRPQSYIEKVACTVLVQVPVTTQVPVRVCGYRTEKREFKETLVHCDLVKVITMKKEAFCVPVNYTTMVKVPVLVPCQP